MEEMFGLIDPSVAEALVHWVLMTWLAVASLLVILLIESRSARSGAREVLRDAVRWFTSRPATADGTGKED